MNPNELGEYQPSVANARAQLAQAEIKQAEERRAQLVSQLASTRKLLRTQRQTLEKLKRQIDKGQNDLDNIRTELDVVSEALAMFEAQKPDVADHLPADPETVEWRTKCATLEAELERLRLKRIALPNCEALRIDGVNLARYVQELMFAERNLLNALNGDIGEGRRGGIFSPM